MAQLKIFVSSTCYDLSMVRGELRNFIINLGHEPVMSDYNDVLFDPNDHTHESCIKEIPNSDVVILIIGSRLGGKALPKAINHLDIEKLKSLSKNAKVLDNTENISITQLEILKAVDSNIPIFTFVDARVLHDHLLYEKNKDKGIIEQIEFPSIEKKETAEYIFEFINYLRFRSKNNSISEFNKISDIEDFLKRQWSALLQRLLYEQRVQKNEIKRIENLSEELKDIKSLILTSISSSQNKEIGRGVLKYRKLINFLLSFDSVNALRLLTQSIEWNDLMNQLEIKSITLTNSKFNFNRQILLLVKNDNTFYEFRYPISVYARFSSEWETFRQLNTEVKGEIINAISESENSLLPFLRHRNQNVDEYVKEIDEKHSMRSSTITMSQKTLNEQVKRNDEDEDEDDTYSVDDNDIK